MINVHTPELTAQAAELEHLREGLQLYRELGVLINEGFDDT